MLQWVIFVKCYVCAITLLSFYIKIPQVLGIDFIKFLQITQKKNTIWPLHDNTKKLANFITQVWKTRSLLWLFF